MCASPNGTEPKAERVSPSRSLAVTVPDRRLDGADRLRWRRLKDAEAESRHRDAVAQAQPVNVPSHPFRTQPDDGPHSVAGSGDQRAKAKLCRLAIVEVAGWVWPTPTWT